MTVQKFLALLKDPTTFHFCRHELLEVFEIYSWSYKFLKIGKIMKTAGRFHSETGLWTGTLKTPTMELILKNPLPSDEKT